MYVCVKIFGSSGLKDVNNYELIALDTAVKQDEMVRLSFNHSEFY